MTHPVIELVSQLLYPKQLSYIQEVVLRQSWMGRIYRDIANESGYDLDYIKEVGAHLWQSLSEVLDQKVIKKNFRSVLLSRYEIADVDEEAFLSTIPPSYPASYPVGSGFLGEFIPLSSALYIDRPPIEERVCSELHRPGSLIRIRAPRKMGKTSLLLRGMAYAKQQGFQTVLINFQQADRRTLTDLDRFLRWLCALVTRQLRLSLRLSDYWDEEIGSKVSCTTYFQDCLLGPLDRPLVLAFDEVNRIFEYPELSQEVLPLLRTWNEAASENETWQKLRLVIVHSTEVYVPLKLAQSPLNVGLPIQLPEFTSDQIRELAQRYQLDQVGIDISDLDPLIALIGGQPHLIQLAFRQLKQREVSLDRLLQEAPTQSGIYSNHLRQHLELLQHYPDLLAAYRQVLFAPPPVRLEAIAAYQLERLGLIKLKGDMAVPGCELYRLYFSSQLRTSMTG